MKIKNLSIILLTILSIGSFSCKEENSADQAINKKLEGTWKVNSYFIGTADHSNLNLSLEFFPYGNEYGNSKWLFMHELIEYSYEVKNNGTTIDFNKEGIYEIKKIQGNELELRGKIGNEFIKISAEKS